METRTQIYDIAISVPGYPEDDPADIGGYAKAQLQEFISTIVVEREKQFIDFFNKADAINKRIHQIELLPGLGKKHMQEIIKQRQEKEFQSFEDLKNRVQNLPDPKKAIEKRILKELTELERHNLFTG